jgi:hypothetical protein
MQDSSTPRFVLVLQSDPTHGHVIQGVLENQEAPPEILTLAQTQEAIAFLRQQPPYVMFR